MLASRRLASLSAFSILRIVGLGQCPNLQHFSHPPPLALIVSQNADFQTNCSDYKNENNKHYLIYNVVKHIAEMRKTLIFLVFSCMTSFIYAQTYNQLVSDKLMNEFLDSYLNDFFKTIGNYSNQELIVDICPMRFDNPDSLLKYFYDWNSLLDCSDFDLDSLLKEYDKTDIVNQIKTQKEFTWRINHSPFSFARIMEPNWTDLYYRLSMPIFSKSREVAIIKQIRECGDDCGDLMINVYLKKQDKWILIAGWGYVI